MPIFDRPLPELNKTHFIIKVIFSKFKVFQINWILISIDHFSISVIKEVSVPDDEDANQEEGVLVSKATVAKFYSHYRDCIG